MAKPLLILDRPARAPREVVERTIQHIKERDYTLPRRKRCQRSNC